jgi:tripartite-type tricarboxylate transporter receptor subunit TctC
LRRRITVLIFFILLGALRPALSDGYPDHVIRIINPYAAGGPADVVARLAAGYLESEVGESLIVENRPGGNSIIGTQYVARAKPDGYTLLLAANTHVVIPSLYKVSTYDPIKDFEPLGVFAFADYVFVTNPSIPADSISTLIAYAKSKPDTLTYGSPGNGSLNDLAIEYLKHKAGLQITRIPFTGGGPAVNAVIGEWVSMMVSSMPGALPLVKAGRLKALAIMGDKPSPDLPGVPTADSTVPGMKARAWYSFVAPAGTPRPVVDKLDKAITALAKNEDFKHRLAALGTETTNMMLAEFKDFMKGEQAKWAGVAAAANIKFSQ